ncbi:unnamed protein product [Ceutorhynchus assimilis]|uniref:NAD(P)H oxidase (H2O2-forming) n=1 Tax=Ceutorhynchus assimilis TaxID=467358 RepID=A0A9N9MCK4_9CUCU|nr:unnamed protein product [Ceutorhynchus assimilis]
MIMAWIHLFSFLFFSEVIFQYASAKCETKPLRNVSSKTGHLFDWLLSDAKKCKDTDFEYPRFDGWHHNLAKPEQGSVGENILRGWSGIKKSSFDKNSWYFALNQLPLQRASFKKEINSITLQLGKQIVQEIFDIGDPTCAERYYFNKPNHEKNYATPYIDGGVIYGTNDNHDRLSGTIDIEMNTFNNFTCVDILRTFWIKCHNLIAEKLLNKCRKWSKAKVYSEARKFTIALQQNIYAYDWLPAWTGGKLNKYKRYDPMANPQIEKLFQAATFLLQHITELNLEHHYNERRNYKWNSDNLLKTIYGAQYSSVDPEFNFVKDEKQFYDIPDINHARRIFKLPPYGNWKEFSKNTVKEDMLITNLTKNDNLKQVDSLLGGIVESTDGPGPLFAEVIVDQFRRIRDGDRFWFENEQNNLFSSTEICKINQILFDDIFFVLMNSSNTETPRNLSIRGNTNSEVLKFSKASNTQIYYYSDDFLYNRLTIFFSTLAAFCCGILALSFGLILLWKWYKKFNKISQNGKIAQFFQEERLIRYPFFLVYEYDGSNGYKRRVLVVMDRHKKQIVVLSTAGTELRVIFFDRSSKAETQLIAIKKKSILILRSNIFIDLVLMFPSQSAMEGFTNEIDLFMTDHIRCMKPTQLTLEWHEAKQRIITKSQYQSLVERFFRVAFAQAFKIEHSIDEILDVDTLIATEVIYTRLTIAEFAEYFNMSRNHEFIKNVFSLVDRDQQGSICFREFLDFIILFAKAKEEDKVRLFFNLYDIDQTLVLSINDFKKMVISFSELTGEILTKSLLKQLEELTKEKLDLRFFKKIIAHQLTNLSRANLDPRKFEKNIRNFLSSARQTLLTMYSSSTDSETKSTGYTMTVIDKQQKNVIRHPEKKSLFRKIHYNWTDNFEKIIWFLILTLSLICVLVYRTWNFYVHSNLIGLRKIMFSISNATSCCILYLHALLFLTMCRNMTNGLKSTYLPLNHLNSMHYYAGYVLALFSLIHVVGKTCLVFAFMEFFLERNCKLEIVNDELENVMKYKWNSPVSISGLLLFFLVFSICGCVLISLKCQLFAAFYYAHKLYALFTPLLIIHAFHAGPSSFYVIILGPILIYLLDYGIGRNKKEIVIPILKTEFLPSNVICLIFQRPVNFEFNVGQWVRLAIGKNKPTEFYPFILSSTPKSSELRIYIRPTHPCAHQVRTNTEVPNNLFPPIRVRMNGPYGLGLKQWRFYDFAVIIVDGNSVGLFASMLRDILYILKTKTKINCKKIYFVWSVKTQRYSEWIVELIREVEEADNENLFSCHLFITEFYQKFDLRSLMIYIFENYYQRISGRNIFTGLKATTHFGNPKYTNIFESIQGLHETVNTAGVFSSGSASFRRTLKTICNRINRHNEYKFEFNFIDKLGIE